MLAPRSCRARGTSQLEVHLSSRYISAASSRPRLCWGAVGRHEILNTRCSLVSILAFHRINYWRSRFGGSSIGAAWPQAKRRQHRLRDKFGGDLAANRPVRRGLPLVISATWGSGSVAIASRLHLQFVPESILNGRTS